MAKDNPFSGLNSLLSGKPNTTPPKKAPTLPSSPEPMMEENSEETSFLSQLRDAAQGIVDMIDEHMNSNEETSESETETMPEY